MCRCLCLCGANNKEKNGNNDSSSSQKYPKTKFYYKNSCEKNNGSGKTPSVKTKCMEAVNEQRARFYIIRRCVTMLLCWHRYEDA